MKKLVLTLIAAALLSIRLSYGSCAVGYSEIIVNIIPDGWPYETSWSITDMLGTVIDTGGSVGDTLCIPIGTCVTFTIHDQYGDGIYSPGGYWLYLDGTLMAH